MSVRCLHQAEGLCPRCRIQERDDLAWKTEQLRAATHELNKINEETRKLIESGALFKAVFHG